MATTTAAPKTKTTGGSFLLEDHNLDNVFTPEDFNEDQQMVAKLAEEFATNESCPTSRRSSTRTGTVTRELLKKASEMGLTNADVPAEYGGSEMDKVSSAIIADYMAKCGSFVVSHGRARRHRHAAYRLLRHRSAEEEIPAQARLRPR